MSDTETQREILEHAIARGEHELREAVDDLTAAMRAELSLRRRIANRPVTWMVGALVLGAWLGRR